MAAIMRWDLLLTSSMCSKSRGHEMIAMAQEDDESSLLGLPLCGPPWAPQEPVLRALRHHAVIATAHGPAVRAHDLPQPTAAAAVAPVPILPPDQDQQQQQERRLYLPLSLGGCLDLTGPLGAYGPWHVVHEQYAVAAVAALGHVARNGAPSAVWQAIHCLGPGRELLGDPFSRPCLVVV